MASESPMMITRADAWDDAAADEIILDAVRDAIARARAAGHAVRWEIARGVRELPPDNGWARRELDGTMTLTIWTGTHGK